MNKELARFKYKKDIINCIEESWDYFGKEDEQRRVMKDMENVYKIASSAKNAPKPEYEAKAKAFDEIIYAINSSSNPGLNGNSYIDAADFTSKAAYIVRKYESGESDAKK